MATLSPKPRVAIVGAGVIGLSVGLCLTETFKDQLDVTIIADKFSPDTTSDRAGGFIMPHLVGSTKAGDETKRWTHVTFDQLNHLFGSLSPTDREKMGMSIVTGYTACLKENQPVPWYYKELFMDFRVLDQQEMHKLNISQSKFAEVWTFKTYVLEGRKYLPWLTEKFLKNGGLIEKRKIENLMELSSYDICINCTGLGARDLIGDKSIYPVRGQYLTVKTQKVKEFYKILEDRTTYVIPHRDIVILGGVEEANEWSTTPDPITAEEIHKRCLQFVPALKDAEIVGGWACLRPARETVCFEVDGRSRSPVVIHNYGHGGQGYVLHWGCAVDAVKLVQQCLK